MSDIIARAREWIGTPYQHQGAARGAGCDCLGLIRGIYAELSGEWPNVPAYTPDWAEKSARETLRDAARAYLLEVPISRTQPGDVLGFRMSAQSPVKHVGILASEQTFIHAYSGRSVTESALVPFWRRRHTHSFRFPTF